MSLNRVREFLSYDPITGEFRWLQNRYRVKAGDLAGTLGSHGYLQIKCDGALYLAHRLAWYLMTGRMPENQIDHDNGVKTDNRWLNLRKATNSQNGANTGIRKNNASGFKGVSYFAQTGKWHAQIMLDKKRYHLGYFDTPEEAAVAYKQRAEQHHGEFYRNA